METNLISEKSNIKYSFCILKVMYLLINGLFVLKYSLRAGSYIGITALLSYFLAACLVFKYWNKIFAKWSKLAVVCCIAFVLLLLIAQYSIDPYKLNVDRWSAIANFIYNMFHGIFPYSSLTHLGNYGDPFPLWCILHIPFYFLKNVGVSIFFGLLFLSYSVYVCKGKEAAFATTLLILFSPAFVYEVLVRSDLITNMMVVAAVINLFIAKNKTLQDNCILVSVVSGLVLCSRLSVAIPLFVWLLKDFLHIKVARKIETILLILCAFFAAFIPFAFGDGHLYFMIFVNPIGYQTVLGSWLELIVIVPVFIYFAMTWKKDYFLLQRNISFSLIFLVLCTFIMKAWNSGLVNLIVNSLFDISYFSMALPFICTAISMKRQH